MFYTVVIPPPSTHPQFLAIGQGDTVIFWTPNTARYAVSRGNTPPTTTFVGHLLVLDQKYMPQTLTPACRVLPCFWRPRAAGCCLFPVTGLWRQLPNCCCLVRDGGYICIKFNYLKPTFVQNPNKIKGKCIRSRCEDGEKELVCLILDQW